MPDLFLVNTKSSDPLNSNAPQTEKSTQVSDFVTKQTFVSLTASTAIVKGIWAALKGVSSSLGKTWVPLVLCGLFGLVQFLLSLKEDELTARDKFVALVIASLNVLVLWSAVLGVSEAADGV